MWQRFSGALALCLGLTTTAAGAATCGGDFATWLQGLRAELLATGASEAGVSRFLRGAAPDPKVLAADRQQGVFQRSFTDFSRRLISADRLNKARAKLTSEAALLAQAERDYGVPPGILLAFWAFETDFGAVQGDFNTRNALLTLAHDCRRPELFRPQIAAAFELRQRGDFDPATTRGAWAGEIGMVQMLPADLLARGVDGDGDGRVDLQHSVADALLSGAALIRDHGWQAGQPWLTEVRLPKDFDLSHSGLTDWLPVADWRAKGLAPREGDLPGTGEAALLLPQGRLGPAFLVWPNFRVLSEWNKSLVYVTTAAYFATRIEGAPVFDPGNPVPGLTPADMTALQEKLKQRGHDVGRVDGILGLMTREAVRREQIRLGLPPDAWPDRNLLERL
ncbi:lytic murein transglycosylase [Falsigemmobacter faecalis]|uniref:Lytic murein transglycosylase n=1 Tax=Falsigemmobacter faecalis TaxID=2488730 RepID=A0A3P3DVE5_9RHOB|nr:lytic murein transglycosylase [Falsigemmobacter faecalis]RRH77954.1 lytic murein transglycosylase [Falsigemmobacter faecalis]